MEFHLCTSADSLCAARFKQLSSEYVSIAYLANDNKGFGPTQFDEYMKNF